MCSFHVCRQVVMSAVEFCQQNFFYKLKIAPSPIYKIKQSIYFFQNLFIPKVMTFQTVITDLEKYKLNCTVLSAVQHLQYINSKASETGNVANKTFRTCALHYSTTFHISYKQLHSYLLYP